MDLESSESGFGLVDREEPRRADCGACFALALNEKRYHGERLGGIRGPGNLQYRWPWTPFVSVHSVVEHCPAGSERGRPTLGLRRTECEGHGDVDDDSAVDPPDALQESHPTAETEHGRFNFHDIAGTDCAPVPDALDAREEDQTVPIFGLSENHD